MKDIQYFDNMQAHQSYKFGVLFAKKGQLNEEVMFHNRTLWIGDDGDL